MIERPAARYGRQRVTRRTRRLVIAALGVLVVAVGLIVAYVGSQRFGSQPVEGELGAYRLIDDQTVEVTVSVSRQDPSRPAVCIVRARSIDGSETGRREILVPPSDQSTVQVTAPVKASQPPVVGDVYGCGFDVPPYLVAP
ncbi:DUF4307 domain-containing protein [Mycolicibacterium litorale]|nr:DUF4307 domain-containing protein [Mycolicibacterium litorale]